MSPPPWITSLLGPGETLLWEGAPVQGVRLTYRNTAMPVFLIVWLIIGGVVAALLEPEEIGPGLVLGFAAIFAGGFVWAIIALFRDRTWRAQRHYLLTDARALVLDGRMIASSHPPGDWTCLRIRRWRPRVLGGGGPGTVIYHEAGSSGAVDETGFDAVADPAEVHARMARLRPDLA